MLVSQLLLRGFGTLFHWTVELLHPLTHLRSVSRHFSLIRHNRTVARASVLWRDINLLIDWLIDWSMLIKSWIYHCTSGLWITFVALIIILCNNSVNVCLVVVTFWCLFFVVWRENTTSQLAQVTNTLCLMMMMMMMMMFVIIQQNSTNTAWHFYRAACNADAV